MDDYQGMSTRRSSICNIRTEESVCERVDEKCCRTYSTVSTTKRSASYRRPVNFFVQNCSSLTFAEEALSKLFTNAKWALTVPLSTNVTPSMKKAESYLGVGNGMESTVHTTRTDLVNPLDTLHACENNINRLQYHAADNNSLLNMIAQCDAS